VIDLEGSERIERVEREEMRGAMRIWVGERGA
jgi:hypothetical protein